MVEHSEILFCVDHLLLLLVVASVADLKIVKSLTQYHPPTHFTSLFFYLLLLQVTEFPRHFLVWRSLLERMPLKAASSAVH